MRPLRRRRADDILCCGRVDCLSVGLIVLLRFGHQRLNQWTYLDLNSSAIQ